MCGSAEKYFINTSKSLLSHIFQSCENLCVGLKIHRGEASDQFDLMKLGEEECSSGISAFSLNLSSSPHHFHFQIESKAILDDIEH